jgi:hypothetical protein
MLIHDQQRASSFEGTQIGYLKKELHDGSGSIGGLSIRHPHFFYMA